MHCSSVVVGLIVALFLWRTGPLGGLHLMYTVQAMIIAQVLIAPPIVAGLSLVVLQQLDAGFRMQIMALRRPLRLFFLPIREIARRLWRRSRRRSAESSRKWAS